MKFQFSSKRWEIEILFLIEEFSKTFAYFLYNCHLLFHLKVPEIPFSDLRLFPHSDDPLLQETSSELVEHQSGVGVWGHVELHLSVRGAAFAMHHAAEVLACAEGLGHALRRWLNVVVGCGGVCRRVLVSLWLPMRISILLFGSTPSISFLLFAFIFFHPYNFKNS